MKLILVGNWKNHPSSIKEASALLSGLTKKARVYKKLSTFIAPPTTYFDLVGQKAKSIGSLAAQDIFFTPGSGTYTGVVTPDILKSFGVKLAIVGHSERRKLGETNQVVAEKVQTALVAGIIPLICIGEEVHDYEGHYFEFLSAQLKASLDGIHRRSDAAKLAIAYEPVWAIGKKAKDAMHPAELAQIVIFIKKVLTEIFGREAAEGIPVLYGGSVEPANAKELLKGSWLDTHL
ncbi:triose-phosphate isomerase [Candidatus Parcubacteria bacterium]|nr:triose-phosphate isomerase [Candidatus Parcubacteria bacterium]